MARVTLDSVTKRFQEKGGGEVIAVEELSLDVADGEFLVLVGPSGCGKSTTLRMIAGLEEITTGTISIGEQVVNDQPAHARNIAMVFQNYALYPHMTVRENMSFGLEESTKMSDAEITERVEDAASTMGIEMLLDRKPGELSGGQQQRVALGRAIVRDPQAFLMDEPLSNLDAKLRSQMRTELQRLQEELTTTTIYVTHDQTEAMTMGDRIAILNDGRLQQVGTPMECYKKPANEFVAGFIGEPAMNFVSLAVEDRHVSGAGIDHTLDDAIADALPESGRVTMGVRPEDILVTEPPGRAIAVDCTVDVVEPLGSENNIYLRTEEDVEFVAAIDDEAELAGPEVTVYFPEDAVHIFDGDTGETLHNQTREVAEQPAWM
jgi:multiple sugar transport system ATP-binding protein